mmetsp:Transcript_18476/g.30223  ORF Transcript_18476/g.30223 Transcript_18476/m.30223 type:complete len:834 (+) Transcript_18476:57-2558(+)
MTGYNEYVQQCIEPDWSSHYIDYSTIKQRLSSFRSRRRHFTQLVDSSDLSGYLALEDYQQLLGASSTNNEDASSYFQYGNYVDAEDALQRLYIAERREFSSLLEQQISNAAIFYDGTLLQRVRELIASGEFDEAASQLLEVVAFVTVNIITFRQLLIRYDGFYRSFSGMPLNEWHLQRSVLATTHPVHDLFRLEGVDKLEKEIILGLQQQANDEENQLKEQDFSIQMQGFLHLLEKTDRSLNKAKAGHMIFRDRVTTFWIKIRQYLAFGFQRRGIMMMDGPRSSSTLRGRHLKQEIEAIGRWKQTKEFDHFNKMQGSTSFKQNLMEINPENVFPLLLNLLACFFFMMNNYIIEPSSAYYAEALGTSDAISGIMIGLAPWFAMISSVVYSFWTNSNYKHPILFAGMLQFIGNLLYANAYSYQSVGMCLLGRAITGLGAPRVINRRYVADATPFCLRTAASAAFAMATAIGAATGPAIAILLDSVGEFEFSLPFLKAQQFNGMTGPGYLMSLIWLIYTIIILFFFGEPVRSGLEELKQREEMVERSSKQDSLLGRRASSINRDGKVVRLLDEARGNDEGHETSSSSEEDFDQGDAYFDQTTSDGTKADDTNESADKSNGGYCSCMKNITRPVIICMSLIFMKRISLEAIVGSTSIITKNRYGWSIKNVGTLHLCNGIIVIPVSILSGYLSTSYEDRYMALCCLSITLLGMSFLFDPTDLFDHVTSYTYNESPFSVGPHRYITGSLLAFSGIEACESFVASLMSKVVPSALAQGTFNSGLLATLVGTGGRAFGDLFITCMGLISIRNLLNLLIIPGATLVATSIALILWNYELLGV